MLVSWSSGHQPWTLQITPTTLNFILSEANLTAIFSVTLQDKISGQTDQLTSRHL